MKRERTAAALLFALCFGVYFLSPYRLVLDPRYAALTAESLVRTGSWNLAPFLDQVEERQERKRRNRRGGRAQRTPAAERLVQGESGPHYQLLRRDGRVLYLYPPGVPLLVAPLVGAANLAGFTSLNADGGYSYRQELEIQALLGALLTAATALFVFGICRRELPLAPAAAVALATALGTSLWSTASRALWTHTLGALLLALALAELMRWEDGAKRRPEWLGALLVAAFWVRPTHALVAVGFALFVLWRHRAAFVRLAATGAVGLGAFLLWSRAVWGAWLPPYYSMGGSMRAALIPEGVAGILFSSARGLLTFTPVLLLIPLALARGGLPANRRAPFALVSALFAVHVLLYAAWPMWWGGGSYGPRMMTDLIPLFACGGALAWRSLAEAVAAGRMSKLELRSWGTLALLLALAGGAAHGAGTISERVFHAVLKTGGARQANFWSPTNSPYAAIWRTTRAALAEDEARKPNRRRPRRPPAAAPQGSASPAANSTPAP